MPAAPQEGVSGPDAAPKQNLSVHPAGMGHGPVACSLLEQRGWRVPRVGAAAGQCCCWGGRRERRLSAVTSLGAAGFDDKDLLVVGE